MIYKYIISCASCKESLKISLVLSILEDAARRVAQGDCKSAPLEILQLSLGLVSSLCLYVMDESLSPIFKKFGEARLYKLKKFERFGASTYDHPIDFRSRAHGFVGSQFF